MFTHTQIWLAIDKLAQKTGHSTSGLAKRAGLDPTAFNKSKRQSPEGKPRWPSTESIAKVLSVTDHTMAELLYLIETKTVKVRAGVPEIPVISYDLLAANPLLFNKEGKPQSHKFWNSMVFHSLHDIGDPDLFAVEMNDVSLSPVYRSGDRLIISPNAHIQKGDRVIFQTKDGLTAIKEILLSDSRNIMLRSCLHQGDEQTIPLSRVTWISRIVWVSQ